MTESRESASGESTPATKALSQSNLAQKSCEACRGGIPAATEEQRRELLTQLRGWEIVDNHHLSKHYKFPDFQQALSWVNRIGAVAEEENHHPDIYLTWGKVRVDVWTHKIDNLTESDFILAAKFDAAEDA